MAYKTAVSNKSIRKIILVLIALPLVASSNIDCSGKAFHCVNSTHFMICVDLGGGLSSTIDNFIIPCPPSTVCQETNHFECEFPQSTTVPPIAESSVLSELRISEVTPVTDASIFSTTANEMISDVQTTDRNFNTVSITTLQEDSVTKNQPVTESVKVENTATTDYTNMGYALTTAPNEIITNINTIDTSTLTPSDVRYSVTKTSTSLYQDTAAMFNIDDATVTEDTNILENVSPTDMSLLNYSVAITINETVPGQSGTETFIVNDTTNSFTTEIDANTKKEFAATTNESSMVEKKLSIANITFDNDLYKITTKEIIDTTVSTITTLANIDITNTDAVNIENFTETFTTESNQLLNDIPPGSTTQYLKEVDNTKNINISEVSVTTDRLQGSDLFLNPPTEISVTKQNGTLPDSIKDIVSTEISKIHTNLSKLNNENKPKMPIIDNNTIQNNDENIISITETTSETMKTNEITQENHTTESISQATILSNNINKNKETAFTTTTLETSTSSIFSADIVTILNLDTSEFTQDGLTIIPEITTESNIYQDSTTSVFVIEPVATISHFEISETNNEIQTTSVNIESATQTLNNIYTVPSENIISSNNFVVLNTSNANNITIPKANIINTVFTESEFMKTTTEETLNMSSINAEVKDSPIRSPERNENKYSFTGFTEDMFNRMTPTMSSLPGIENVASVTETIVEEYATESLDIKTVSATIQNISKINNTLLNLSDSTKDIKTSMFITESYKMTENLSTINGITSSLSVNDKDQTLITTVTDIPNKINQNINIKESYQESTTAPSVTNLEVTAVGDNYIGAPDINFLDGHYMVEKMTTEINTFEQLFSGNTLSTPNGLNDTIHDNVTASTFTDIISSINNLSTTEVNLISNNNYQVESVTTKITNSDTINQRDYATFATTVESQMFTSNLNKTSMHTGTNEAVATDISLPALPLYTNNVVATTQESTLNSDFAQSTATEPAPTESVLKLYLDNAKLKVATERTVGETLSNVMSYSPPVKEATKILINNYDEFSTIKSLMPNDVFTVISNYTSNQVFLQNNTEFKPSTISTTHSIKNQKNEFGNTTQQLLNYDSTVGILSETNINTKHDAGNISNQMKNISTFTENTVDSKNIGRLYENINSTETLNTKTIGAEDVTFIVSNQTKDRSTAFFIDDDLVGETIINKNMKKVNHKIQASTTGNVTTGKKTEQYESLYKSMEDDVNLNFQSNQSIYTNNEEDILDRIPNNPELPIIANKQTSEDINGISNDSTNKGFLKDSLTSQVVIENYQNEYNLDYASLVDRTKDGLSLDYTQNNTLHNFAAIVNDYESLNNKINTENATEGILENTTINDSLSPNQNLGQNVENSTIDGSLKLGQNAEASETNKIINRNVSFVESQQVTSMPTDGFLGQSVSTLLHNQKISQNVESIETNVVNKSLVTNTINKTGLSSIETKASVTPNDGSFKHTLTSDEKLVQNMDYNFGRYDSKHKEDNNVTENTPLPSNLSFSEFSKDSVHNKLGNVAEDQKGVGVLLRRSENTADNTQVEHTPVISTKSNVKYPIQNSNTDSNNSTDNGQKVINPFCFTRNRGRYADREDCTKFYICIGKTEPIVGKCPTNTVFSEIRKQCTKNKSHCIRGNEFQCLSEGRFSDILKNNAYYICVKRQNKFIRFKFQCQNGYYLNKITVRCSKQLEAINQFSISLDNSNSEKSVSEGMSKETNKSKNSKKESNPGEEFECKKEGKFADTDNCRKFYVCTKTKKSEFRLRRKSCDSDEVFHKDKKKCVDADSYEC